MTIIEAGARQYEHVAGWGQLREGWTWGEARAISVDAEDNVHVLFWPDHPYVVFDKQGRILDNWGESILDDGHGIHVTPDAVFFILRRPHVVFKFSHGGKHLMTLGKRGVPSDTGWTDENREVLYAGPPFNFPTDAGLGPNGEIYVSDGYHNARIHVFEPDGKLRFSWGEPGTGPGQFNVAHGVTIHRGRVYVADRLNNRIQIFGLDGAYIAEWGDFLLPCKVVVGPDETLYVAELDSRITMLDLEGNVLGRIGDGVRRTTPGELCDPHWLAVDSAGDIYVGEVSKGLRMQKFARKK